LNRILVTLLASGVMVLVVSAIIGALNTGVIAIGRSGKIERGSAPFTFWLLIATSIGVVVLCSTRLIWGPLH
jgi:hypothetical protein